MDSIVALLSFWKGPTLAETLLKSKILQGFGHDYDIDSKPKEMQKCGSSYFDLSLGSTLESEKARLLNQSTQILEELCASPAGPAATPVCVKQAEAFPAAMLETLKPAPVGKRGNSSTDVSRRMSVISETDMDDEFAPLSVRDDSFKSEGEQNQHSGEETNDSASTDRVSRSPKSWTAADMDSALDALRNHNMSLTKASATFGIPSTTLWQRAHRMGIDTPKKEAKSKTWSDDDLKAALDALRAGTISANKASKAYGIPSSTLYKMSRRAGIRLSAPFHAAPVSWRRRELRDALTHIRRGEASVQHAARLYGIPTGTLYGRCKREGIELSRSNPTPWSEDAMREALEAVRVGQMSINQAAIHFNLPYSSLYGRFKRCKYKLPVTQEDTNLQEHQNVPQTSEKCPQYQQQPSQLYALQHTPDITYYSGNNDSHYQYQSSTYENNEICDQTMFYSQNNGLVSS